MIVKNRKKNIHFYDLPVYKDVYSMLLWVYKHMPYMSKQYRYTLGEPFKLTLQAVLVAIYKASVSKDKLAYVRQAKDRTAEAHVYIQLMRDLHLAEGKNLIFLIDKVASISKQLYSWECYCADRQTKLPETNATEKPRPLLPKLNKKKDKKDEEDKGILTLFEI